MNLAQLSALLIILVLTCIVSYIVMLYNLVKVRNNTVCSFIREMSKGEALLLNYKHDYSKAKI